MTCMTALMTKSSWRHVYNGGRRHGIFVAQLHTTEAMFIMPDDMECRTNKDLPWWQKQRPPEVVDVRIS